MRLIFMQSLQMKSHFHRDRKAPRLTLSPAIPLPPSENER